MLEFLKPLKDKDSDCITFIKGEEEDSISVMGRNYVDPGEPIGGSDMV
jgi:hypothetical protein